nr:uncharacterized protein LOC105862006 isoform X3 [Microcebus murinus]
MAPASPGYTSPPTIGFSPFQVSVALRRTASYDHSQPVLWPCEPRQERKGPVTFLTPDPLHTVPFSQTLQTSGQPSALAENPGAQIWTTLPRGLQDLGWVFKAEREQRSLPFPCATCALRQRPASGNSVRRCQSATWKWALTKTLPCWHTDLKLSASKTVPGCKCEKHISETVLLS